MAMAREDLKFHPHIANSFMRIAGWAERNVGNAYDLPKLLPPDYTTIDKLTRLNEPTLKRLIEDGTICPTLSRNEVAKVLRLERVKADEQRVLNLVPVKGKFRTVVIDPAWEYNQSIAGRAKPSYAMQALDQLRQLDVRAWADEPAGCHLYCWVTNSFSYEGHKLVEHWGFQHQSVITWIKPPPFGLGKYFRNSTEQILFATLGKTQTRPAAASIPTHFEAPRGAHSEKPEKFYEIVRAASYPPYGEANQREPRPDFTNLFEPDGAQEAAE
jgi:N6-adenosine-specific RNA methylase IME4